MLNLSRIEEGWNAASEKKRARWAFASFLVVLLVLSICLYWRFIFQDNLLIYFGYGSDSIGQTVPFLLNGASRVESGDFSFWNQYQFLGAVTGQFLNPDYFPTLLGEDHVARMMVVYQVVKIVLAGVFFYLFTGYLGLRYRTRFVVGLGYAFCARMIAVAAWPAYTLEITLAGALLWGFERYYADQRRVLVLPLALAGIIMGLGIYGFVLYVVVLFAYAVFRVGFSWDRHWSAGRSVRFFAILLLLVGISLLISSPVLIPYLDMFATSSRAASDLASGLSLASALSFSSLHILATEVVRMFGSSTLGVMEDFSGSLGPLNSPAYYCGILVLLALPFAFKGRTCRQKGWLAFIVVAALAYVLLDGFRYVLNGFSVSGSDFRQSSFWITVVMLVVGAYGMEWLWGHAERLRVAIWAALLLVLLLLSAWLISNEVNWLYIVLAAVIVVVYAALLIGWRIPRSSSSRAARVFLSLLLVLVPAEFLVQDYKQVTGGSVLEVNGYAAQLGTDPEDSVLAVAGEPEDTYRIDYKTMMLTRSMADTYLGTQAYIGGSGISGSTTEFLKEVGNSYIDELGYSRYVYGFYDDALNSLLGVKYLVYSSASEDYYIPFGYREVADDGVYRVLKNDYPLPLIYGYTEDEVISKDDLETVDRSDRGLQMLATAVVPDSLAMTGEEDLVDMSSERVSCPVVAKTEQLVTVDSKAELALSERPSEGGYLELALHLDAEPTTSGNLNILAIFSNSTTGEREVVDYYTAAGGEDIFVPVLDEGFDLLTVEISASNACDDAVISDIAVRECSSTYFDPFLEAVESRLAGSPEVSSYHAGKLEGSIEMEGDGYLATSIPWNESWRVFIDGEEVEPFRINIGFVGAPIEAGFHTIELVFDDASRIASYVICGCSVVGLLVAEVAFAMVGRKRPAVRA